MLLIFLLLPFSFGNYVKISFSCGQTQIWHPLNCSPLSFIWERRKESLTNSWIHIIIIVVSNSKFNSGREVSSKSKPNWFSSRFLCFFHFSCSLTRAKVTQWKLMDDWMKYKSRRIFFLFLYVFKFYARGPEWRTCNLEAKCVSSKGFLNLNKNIFLITLNEF